jgi:predicted dehydrogenase
MKIGLIGSGFMGGVHLSAIERLEGATLTALASRTRPTADAPARGNLHHLKTAALPEHVRWYADWQEMIVDPEIDAIDICLPSQMHREVALRAFELGKHVLCEKPMALTTEDCDVMMEAAVKSGRTFMVAQVLRFMFPYQYAAGFVRELGRRAVTACTLHRQTGYPQWSEWLSREELSGGAIVDLLSHDIDMAMVLFGAPETVTAVAMGEIDTMRGRLHYANGLDVLIEGGWMTPGVQFSAGFRIDVGDDDALVFEGDTLERIRDGAGQPVKIPEHDPYQDEIAYFVECAKTGTRPERCLPAESARALRVANLLRQSRSEGGKEMRCGM